MTEAARNPFTRVEISDGRILLSIVGERVDADPLFCIAEDVAARALAAVRMAHPGTTIVIDPSCDNPAEHWREEFEIGIFRAMVDEEFAKGSIHSQEIITEPVAPHEARDMLIHLAEKYPDYPVFIARARPNILHDGLSVAWLPLTLMKVCVADQSMRAVADAVCPPMKLGPMASWLAEKRSFFGDDPSKLLLESFGHGEIDEQSGLMQATEIHVEDGKVYIVGDWLGDVPERISVAPIYMPRTGDLIRGREGWQYGQRLPGIVFVTDVTEFQNRYGSTARRVMTRNDERRAVLEHGGAALFQQWSIDPELDGYDESRVSAFFLITQVLLYRDGKHIVLREVDRPLDTDVHVVEARRCLENLEPGDNNELIRFALANYLGGNRYAMRASPILWRKAGSTEPG